MEKIDGSPFNPWTLSPHLAYKTTMTDAARVEGAICPKGQAGIQTLYDPYRIVKVLKRDGEARGKQVEEHPLRPSRGRDRGWRRPIRRGACRRA